MNGDALRLNRISRPGGVEIGDRILVIQPSLDQLFVVPQILADRQARGRVQRIADAYEILGLVRRAGLEIATLVEDVVRRQEAF